MATYEYIRLYQSELPYEDLEAVSVVIVDFITALVDRIIFKEARLEKERLLNVGIEALYPNNSGRFYGCPAVCGSHSHPQSGKGSG